MTTLQAVATIRPTCDARTGEFRGEYRFERLWCNVSLGLRSFTDARGILRHYCAAAGHREAVVARYGLAPVAPEDGVTAAKARDDLRDGVAHFGWRSFDIEVECE